MLLLLLLSYDEEYVNIFATHSKWVGAKFTCKITSLEDDLCPFKYWWHSHSNMMKINCANHSESPKLCNITVQRFLSCIFPEWHWTVSCWKIWNIFLLFIRKLPGRRLRLWILMKTRLLPKIYLCFCPKLLPNHIYTFPKGLILVWEVSFRQMNWHHHFYEGIKKTRKNGGESSLWVQRKVFTGISRE